MIVKVCDISRFPCNGYDQSEARLAILNEAKLDRAQLQELQTVGIVPAFYGLYRSRLRTRSEGFRCDDGEDEDEKWLAIMQDGRKPIPTILTSLSKIR